MDIWTATYAEAALVGLSLLSLSLVLVAGRRERRTVAESKAVAEDHAIEIAKVRLLEFRVRDLSSHVADLERVRDSLVDVDSDVIDLRAELVGGRRNNEAFLIRIPSAEE
jgi:hypothetical protein